MNCSTDFQNLKADFEQIFTHAPCGTLVFKLTIFPSPPLSPHLSLSKDYINIHQREGCGSCAEYAILFKIISTCWFTVPPLKFLPMALVVALVFRLTFSSPSPSSHLKHFVSHRYRKRHGDWGGVGPWLSMPSCLYLRETLSNLLRRSKDFEEVANIWITQHKCNISDVWTLQFKVSDRSRCNANLPRECYVYAIMWIVHVHTQSSHWTENTIFIIWCTIEHKCYTFEQMFLGMFLFIEQAAYMWIVHVQFRVWLQNEILEFNNGHSIFICVWT